MFLIISFCSLLLRNILGRRYLDLYSFFAVSGSIFFVGLVILFFRSDREKRILVASILIVVIKLVSEFCASLLDCLVLFFLHTVKKIPEPLFGGWKGGLVSGIGYCFAIFAIYLMSKRLEPVFCCMPGKWYVILAVPLLVIVTVYDVASLGASNGIMVRSGGGMGVYYDQIFSHSEFLILAFLSMAAAGFYVFGMNRIYLEQEKSGQYHAQIAVYKMMAEQYRQSERLRHDMKNHIIALLGLLENKEWEKIENYLKNMEGSAALGTREEITGNRIVDVLLYQKRNIAEEKNIIWECDVHIPGICHINEFDLCVLFGNILDNAVEACERLQRGRSESGSQPFINIQGRMVKKCFLLEVKNSADMSDKNKVKSAGKENPEEHGIGLLNISDVVHRYNGVMNIDVQNGVFLISVLIPLEDAGHDIKQAV